MKILGAAFRDQSDLRSGALPLICSVIGCGNAEFLNGVLCDGQHGSKRVAVGLIVDVHSVKRDVALIAARSIDSAVARVLVRVCNAVAGVSHSGL